MKKALLILLLVISATALRAANPGAQRVVDAVRSLEPFRSSVLGVLAVTDRGDTVASFCPSQRMNPASALKLVSTGLALNELGADFRYKTSLFYSGQLGEDGSLEGDLFIVGGGDPTLASNDSIALPADSLFAGWKRMLDEAGIRRIEGDIIGDGSFFDGEFEHPNWQYQDLGTYYATGSSGLNFYRNIQEIWVEPGNFEGDSVSCMAVYPLTPWISYSNISTTGPAGSGDKLYLYNSPLSEKAIMTGTFALDRRAKIEECSNKFPARTCAHYFREYLLSKGMEVCGKAKGIPAGSKVKAAAEEKILVGESLSPTLRQISKITLWRSDNLYAEAALRIMGKQLTGSASYNASRQAALDALGRLGLDTGKIKIDDGSGLSRENFVSPGFFCDFLLAMLSSRAFPDFSASIGSPGQGKYQRRLAGENESLKKRILYKSGSMGGVQCFCGYVLPSPGKGGETIAFAVMLNNCTAPASDYMEQIDRIIAAIAKEN